MKKLKCPKCGSIHVEMHGEKPGDTFWYLCRECGFASRGGYDPENAMELFLCGKTDLEEIDDKPGAVDV